MRTFHIGGAAQKGTEISNIESKYDGKIKYLIFKVSCRQFGSEINMSRSGSLSILDENKKEKAKHRIAFWK